MNKNRIFQAIKEEIKLFSEQNQMSSSDLSAIVDKLLKKLDSIDLSLNLIYGTLAGAGTAEIGARQKAMGRFTTTRPSLASRAKD